MKGSKSPTVGTKDFSHPQRSVDDFDESIDDFSLASIALSLKAISLNPTLYDDFGASDRLLFSATDYLDLSKSKVMIALQSLLADEDLNTLMSMFLLASAKKNLSMCSFRMFLMHKPDVEEVLSTEVTAEDLKNAVEDEYGVKYSKDGKRLLKAPEKFKNVDGKYVKVFYYGGYSIKKGVKVICDKAFSRCSIRNINIKSDTITGIELWKWPPTSINIPNSVTSIGSGAFGGCESLTSINIPNSVKNIGSRAFGSCRSLTSVNIPNSVESIEHGAFSDCGSLVSIDIPNSVTCIGSCVFENCSSLTSIRIYAEKVPSIFLEKVIQKDTSFDIFHYLCGRELSKIN